MKQARYSGFVAADIALNIASNLTAHWDWAGCTNSGFIGVILANALVFFLFLRNPTAYSLYPKNSLQRFITGIILIYV